MAPRPAFLVAVGILLLAGSLTGFHTTDQTYGYAPIPVPAVPDGEHVYRYDRLSPADREFVADVGVSADGVVGGDSSTFRFDEREDPRDLLDFATEPDALRSPGSHVERNGSVYRLSGGSVPGFRMLVVALVLLPKYAIAGLGLVLVTVGVDGGTEVGWPVLVGGLLLGTLAFGVVEWFVPDVARHVLPVAAGAAVSGAVFYWRDRTGS